MKTMNTKTNSNTHVTDQFYTTAMKFMQFPLAILEQHRENEMFELNCLDFAIGTLEHLDADDGSYDESYEEGDEVYDYKKLIAEKLSSVKKLLATSDQCSDQGNPGNLNDLADLDHLIKLIHTSAGELVKFSYQDLRKAIERAQLVIDGLNGAIEMKRQEIIR